MTGGVKVYGFGSAFDANRTARDVDLLIVHDDTSISSCALAIQCKHQLKNGIRNAHVTMLSESEEANFQFVETARAFQIGLVLYGHLARDVEVLIGVIADRRQPNG